MLFNDLGCEGNRTTTSDTKIRLLVLFLDSWNPD